MKVVVCVRFDSRLIPSPQPQTPKRWRALHFLRTDPINISRTWAEHVGKFFPISLGTTKVLISFDPTHWDIYLKYHSTAATRPHPNLLTPLQEHEVQGALLNTELTQVIQAMTRCAAVHAAEHLEGLAVTGALHERWNELCLWASHIALLNIDLKRSSSVHHAHRKNLGHLEKAWSHFDPITIGSSPSQRILKNILSNLEYLPHLGTQGSALGAKVSLTTYTYLALSALGQWFWIWIVQYPELMSTIQKELSTQLRGIPYHPKRWRKLPYLSSFVLELCRLYPSDWCISTPIPQGELSNQLCKSSLFSELLHHRRPPTHILLFPYWWHRDEAQWARAREFDPLRFLNMISNENVAPDFSKLRPFGLTSPLLNTKGQLIFHTLLALLTGLLRRGTYQVDEDQARELSQVDPSLKGGIVIPTGEILCRFTTADHVAYIRSGRV